MQGINDPCIFFVDKKLWYDGMWIIWNTIKFLGKKQENYYANMTVDWVLSTYPQV